jgi:hypothetical protein
MSESTPPEVLARLPHSPPSQAGHPPIENGEPPSSLIAGLREQHRRIEQRTSVLLELPLWEGKLACRYHYLDERSLDRLIRRITGSDDPATIRGANADLLIGGCDELLARRDEDDDWGPIIEGEHLRYDTRLAELLQLPLEQDSARGVVDALFGGRVRGAMALGAHAQQYIEWLQGQAPEVAEQFRGESPSAGT